MPEALNALLLGIIEGITEFLPISSTGHLIIAEQWLGHRSVLFNVAIQAAAILAVVFIYWRKLLALGQAFMGRRDVLHPDTHEPISVAFARDFVIKLGVAFAVTVVGMLVVKKLGWELPDEVRPIAYALVIGAVWMVIAEHFAAKRAAREGERSNITWTIAILVGLAQVVAGVFPGTSRSAATIFVALLAGCTSRAAATEFAFLVGIPTMFAATGYEFLSLAKDGQLGHENWTSLGIASLASAVTAFIAVKWLLRYIQTHRFTAFSVYRAVLAVVLLALVPAAA